MGIVQMQRVSTRCAGVGELASWPSAASDEDLSLHPSEQSSLKMRARMGHGAAIPPSVSIVPFQIEDRRQQRGDLREQRLVQLFLVPLDVAHDGVWAGRAEESGWNLRILAGKLQRELADAGTASAA